MLQILFHGLPLFWGLLLTISCGSLHAISFLYWNSQSTEFLGFKQEVRHSETTALALCWQPNWNHFLLRKKTIEHFLLQLQLVLSTATRVRNALEVSSCFGRDSLWGSLCSRPTCRECPGGISWRDRQDHGRWRHRDHTAGLEGPELRLTF